MSTDFKKILIKNNLLNVTDQLSYGVYRGGQQMTTSIYSAISKSTSSISYNIQVPSETTIIDRRVMMRNTFTIRVKRTGVVAGQHPIQFSKNACLAPFPASQAFNTVAVSINNSTVNQQYADVLSVLLKMMKKEDLANYGSTAPVMTDYYGKYEDSVNGLNNMFSDYTSTDNIVSPNGAFIIDNIVNNGVAGANGDFDVDITFSTVEPLFISPFISGDPKSNNQGMYGIQSLSFQFNLLSNMNRVFRCSLPSTATLVSVDKSEIILNYLQPHSTDLLPSRNVLPYFSCPLYKDIVNTAIPLNGTIKIQSPSLQLNMIPDKILIFVRRIQSSKTCNDPDFHLPITGISLQVFTQSGILSSASPTDLYRFSKESGYEGNWLDWSGVASKYRDDATPLQIPTSGSILVLEFGKHIPLLPYYSQGSLANASIQYSIDVKNNTGAILPAQSLELCMMTINSGLLTIEKGVSQEWLALLSKQDVLETVQNQEAYSESDMNRLVGGGFFDKLRSVASKALPKLLPVARQLLEKSDNEYAKTGAKILKSVGYGETGGGRSGGRLSSRV